MKNRITNITKMRTLLGITTLTTLCLAPLVQAGKPSHGGGSGGGLPYATVSTVSQLIADINYANSAGGAITFSLAPGTTFDLTSANNTTAGGNGLPVIGATKAVNLTILGNGDTIERVNVINRYGSIKNPFRLFEVAYGASLTLDHLTLQGGWVGSGGGAIANQGTVNVINGSTLSGNGVAPGGIGGGIYIVGGTVTVSDSTVSGNWGDSGGGIYNLSGTVAVSNGTISGNSADDGAGIFNSGGTVTVSNSSLSGNRSEFGGAIYNDSSGTVTVDSSTFSDNEANFFDYTGPGVGGDGGAIYNSVGTVTISNSTLSGNVGDLSGGGIYNASSGMTTVKNSTHIFGNTVDDVQNSGTLYLDGSSTIDFLQGEAAMLLP